MKIVLNVSLQACEVQSRCSLVRRLITAVEMGLGHLLACGLKRKELCKLIT